VTYPFIVDVSEAHVGWIYTVCASVPSPKDETPVQHVRVGDGQSEALLFNGGLKDRAGTDRRTLRQPTEPVARPRAASTARLHPWHCRRLGVSFGRRANAVVTSSGQGQQHRPAMPAHAANTHRLHLAPSAYWYIQHCP